MVIVICKIQQRHIKVNLLLHLLMVKMHFIILLSLLALAGNISATIENRALPEGGVLDLRGTVLNKDVVVSLNGEWEFYWEKLLTPENYQDEKKENPVILMNVPSYWCNYEIDGESLPGMGYATYGLMIILPPDYHSTLCFDIPVFDCAYNLYLNDSLFESNGQVGTSRNEEEPWYKPSGFCYVPHEDTIQLLIQVSNFHHRRGGFWKSAMIGGSGKILKLTERRRIHYYSTIGVLFFITFFFIVFWLFSRWETLMLLFALTTLGILIRSANTGLYFSNAFLDAPWAWQVRMEYFGTYIAYIFGVIFLHRMFPTRHMKHVIRVNTIITSLAIVSVFVLPVHLFSYGMLLFQPLILLFLSHYLVISLIGVFRRKIMDAIFFVSLAFFIYTMVNDILVANSAGAIYNNYLSQISFQLFVFAMTVLIIIQWVNNYNKRLQLEASLRFKNKVLSVIAHDLKNPIASVAQFSDLLVTKPDLASKKHIVISLQESSHAAVTLLDNLLYWGRSQADELIVTPNNFDIEKLVLKVVSLFTHSAIQKELKLKAEVSPEIIAFADQNLANIVVRNLVSNAIKFTPREGSVFIKATAEKDHVVISVIDTGIGIKPEILEQFEKSGHLYSSSGTEREQGTGLGLQLVRDLVTKNGGTLKIRSKPDEGSTFTFTLPVGS